MSTENKDELTPFKILSIDGGGMKGLYSARILQHFEEKFNCVISDYFDLICGTSTGGLIALAISLKIPMKDVCAFYEKEGPQIFRIYKKNKILSWIFKRSFGWGDVRQIAYEGKFSDEPLKKALEKFFGDHVIGDSNNYLCIPSYTITEARSWVFKKDHHDLKRDNKVRYVDVALATSAAPTFFPMAEIKMFDYKQFIDGGVWANNPTLVGLLEALKYFAGSEKPFKKIKILSLSSLSSTGGKPTGLKRNRSFIDWNKELFETSMTGQSYFSNFFMNEYAKVSSVPIDYLRIPSADIARDQEDHIQLDVATQKAINLINGKGNDQGLVYSKLPGVIAFFSNRKTSNP